MAGRELDPDEDRRYIRPLPGESEADYRRALERALADEIAFAWAREWDALSASPARAERRVPAARPRRPAGPFDPPGRVLWPPTTMAEVVGRPTRVSLVEDEAFMRALLERALAEVDSVRVVHSLSGAQEAALAISPHSSDVAILDVNLPDGNGVALGLQLQRADPDLAIVLLSSQDVMGLFDTVQDEATRPWSYLSKRSTFTQNVLVDTVEAAAAGQVVVDPYLTQRSTPRAGSPLAELTLVQFRVLRLVAEGLSNAAIAKRLDIKERSVEGHLLGIYRRLGIDGRESNRRVAAVLAFMRQTGRAPR